MKNLLTTKYCLLMKISRFECRAASLKIAANIRRHIGKNSQNKPEIFTSCLK